MLIYLDPSLIDYFKSSDASLQDFEALDNIISSHRKGYHYVISTRQGLESLRGLENLSVLCKRQLAMMSHDYTTLSSIIKHVATKITVKVPHSEFRRNEKILNGCTNVVFEIPLNQFIIPEVLEKTVLISEHLDDCYFYEFLGNRFYNGMKLPTSISFQRTHGGGSDTHKVLTERIENNTIIFTIVDSDRKDPTSSLGRTSKQVEEKYEEFRLSKMVGCEILPVHEKENLVSPKIYGVIGNNIRKAALEQLNLLCAVDKTGKLYSFLDLKKGLHSENFIPYFEEIFNIEGLIPKQKEDCRNFENEFVGTKEEFIAYCEKQKLLNKDERIIKYLIEPLSSNPLVNFNLEKLIDKINKDISETQKNTPQQIIDDKKNKIKFIENIYDHLLEFQAEYLKNLGSQIREWGLCNPKKAAY
jgi:hypothetical protein